MHKYDNEGNLVPAWEPGKFSVTTILDVVRKKGIEDWEARVGKEEAELIRTKSAAIGNRVHLIISELLNGAEVDPGEDLEPYLTGWSNWRPEDTHLTDVQSELYVQSDKYGYAGTIDLVCSLGDEPWIVDFKTGKSMQPTHGLQLVAYRQAYYEMTGVKCRMAVLQLGTGTKKQWKWREYKEPFYVFKAHKDIFDWQMRKNPIKTPVLWNGGRIEV